MKLKKWISIAIIGTAMAGILAACGSSNTAEQTAAATTAEVQTTETVSEAQDTETAAQKDNPQAEAETEEAENSDAEGGKTLVVYYSASGNTEEVANTIAEVTGGDLFELEPAEPYSDADLNWTDDNSRVTREHENEAERDVELVSSTVEDQDSYDTVFIGYPIWWGIAAWPVDGFVEANDFTGKTVIPFATSSSSGLGQSGELLAEMAGTGDWQEGMRFRSGVSAEDVTSWVEELGLGQ